MKSILLFALSLCCYFTLGAQTIYYVKSGGSGAKTGASWSDALDNIQVAIDGASKGDQVWVAQGAFNGLAANGFGFILKDGVSLYGGFAGTESAIDQRDLSVHTSTLRGGYSSEKDNTISGMNIGDQTVVDGFLLTPFNPSAYSRGVYLNNSSPIIQNCTFKKCVSYAATSSHNGYGAAVFMENNSSPKFINCNFEDNIAINYGGALYVLNSSPVFIDCTFSNNEGSSTGGGALNSGSSSTYSHCIFSGNISTGQSSSRGGALSFSGGGNSKINNCLITNNTANYGGAAISCFDAGLSVLNCTITGNPAVNETGGAAILYSETGTNTLTIANSIIWNNVSTHGDGSLELYEIVGLNGSADPITGSNLIKYGQYGSLQDDPQFVDADNGNFQLLAASPAIDAGDNSAAGFVASDTDLIGNHRVINNVVDLGAYEALTNKITNNGETSFKGFSGTLDITGNPYENDLKNTYKWKMIISSPSVNEIMLVDPDDLAGNSAIMTGMGITFDSTHFQVSDLSVMPALLNIITQESGWDTFTGDIILSRPVYPNLGTEDSLISNTVTITIESVLPVTIKDFTGQVQNGLATLNWHTAVENAFDHFELEKSLDGKAFVSVSSIAAKGNSSTYRKVTPQVEQMAYYRLKLVNKDGSSSYYKQLLTLTQNTSRQAISVYPNPATTTIHINVEVAAQFRLFDGTGKVVKSGSVQAGLNDIDISNLSKGVYFGEIDGIGRFKVIKK